MNFYPIDLTTVIIAGMGLLIVLIPVFGLTVRFALKPTVEALMRARSEVSGQDQAALLERRLNLLETQLEQTSEALTRLSEEAEFRRQLAMSEPAEPEPLAIP